MPFKAYQLKIGSNTFLVPNIKGAHTVEDQKLGPSGPIEFTWKNPTGDGMLGIDEGIQFRPNKYLSSKGADAAFPGQVLIQPQATTVSVASGAPVLSAPIKQVDAVNSTGSLSAFLVQNGTTLHALNYATPRAWTAAASLNQVGKDIVVYGTSVAATWGAGYVYGYGHPAAYTSVPSTAADFLGVMGNTLYRAVTPNTVFAGTGGSLGTAWDSGSTIADSSYNIQSLRAVEQILLIGKTDGIYSIDADGTVVPFTPELRQIASSNFASTARTAVFNGDYYFATDYGIIQISGADGQKHRIGLDQLASPDLPTPQVRALCSDDRCLYALVQNTSTDLMILRRDIHGAWNTYYWDGTAGTKQGQHIGISAALGYPALFFSYFDGASTYTTKAIRLSVYPNPSQDTNYRYDTTSQNYWVRLGRFGPLESNIVLDRCTVLSDNLTANITITPYLSTDGAAAAQFGSAAATSSPYAEIKPATASSGHYHDAYAYLATNAAATSPVLRSISFKGYLQPGRRRVHHYLIAAAGNYTTPQGDLVLQDPTTTISNLETLRTTAGTLTVIDENGTTFTGIVTDVAPLSVDGLGGKEDTPSYSIPITIVEKA